MERNTELTKEGRFLQELATFIPARVAPDFAFLSR